MLIFPNAKINLGLSVVSKRDDGYHNIETVFYPIPMLDALEVIEKKGDEGVEFTTSGLEIKASKENNLCLRAWEVVKADYPALPPVSIHLHKAIPIGGGIGGGSSDGAFMLKLLNEKFKLGISPDKLLEYALQLGSDCPFFILNTPVIASGRGEEMQSIDISLSSYTLVLVHPGIQVSTAAAFSGIIPSRKQKAIRDIIQQPASTWKNELINDFEDTIFPKYPQLHSIKESLYDHGAIYASMTGTGSCLYGLFEKNESAEKFMKIGDEFGVRSFLLGVRG